MFLFPKPCVILALDVIASVLWLIKLTDICGRTVSQDLSSESAQPFLSLLLNQTSLKLLTAI